MLYRYSTNSTLKRNIFQIIALCLFLSSHFIQAQDSDIIHLIENGISSYQKKEYLQSVQSFQQVIDAGYESADIYYNLGNALTQLHREPEAILAFERTLKIDAHHEQAMHNLALLNKEETSNIIRIEDFFIYRWYKHAIRILRPNVWAILFLMAFAIWVGVVLMKWLKEKVIEQKYINTLLFVCIILLGMSIGSNKDYNDHSQAIIMQNNIALYKGPDERSPHLLELPAGLKVTVLDQLQEWYKVRLPDRSEGWIPIDVIKRI